MSYETVATIGQGVVIRESSIPGGGNGLWTARAFCRNDLITEYCGPIIDHKKALKLRKRGRHTHVRVLNSQWLYIDGLKVPKTGEGGASFANDARDSTINNACFVQKFDRKLGRDRVFLKALRDLQPREEVFVSYGNTYWQNSKQAAKSVKEAGQQLEQRRSPRQKQQQRRQQQIEQQLHAVKDPVCSKQGSSTLHKQSQQQHSQQSSHSCDTQQQEQHGSGNAAARPLSMQEIVEQGERAKLELQEIALAKKTQQQQQQQYAPTGSQESVSSQVGWRRSERVRSQTEQQPQQQQQAPSSDQCIRVGADIAAELGPRVIWGAHKKRSHVYVLNHSKGCKRRSSGDNRLSRPVPMPGLPCSDSAKQLQRIAAAVGKRMVAGLGSVRVVANETQSRLAAARAGLREFRRKARL